MFPLWLLGCFCVAERNNGKIKGARVKSESAATKTCPGKRKQASVLLRGIVGAGFGAGEEELALAGVAR